MCKSDLCCVDSCLLLLGGLTPCVSADELLLLRGGNPIRAAAEGGEPGRPAKPYCCCVLGGEPFLKENKGGSRTFPDAARRPGCPQNQISVPKGGGQGHVPAGVSNVFSSIPTPWLPSRINVLVPGGEARLQLQSQTYFQVSRRLGCPPKSFFVPGREARPDSRWSFHLYFGFSPPLATPEIPPNQFFTPWGDARPDSGWSFYRYFGSSATPATPKIKFFKCSR